MSCGCGQSFNELSVTCPRCGCWRGGQGRLTPAPYGWSRGIKEPYEGRGLVVPSVDVDVDADEGEDAEDDEDGYEDQEPGRDACHGGHLLPS